MSEALIVRLNIKNPETTAEVKKAVSAVPGLSISSNGAPCDVLFMEIGIDTDEEFRVIEQIRTKGLAREIFLTSSRKDPEFLIRALKTGIKEFFTQPVNRNEIIASLTKLKKGADAEAAKKTGEKKGVIISVIGSKGGVGATTTAVNLAVFLREASGEKSVVLMDMNPLLGGIHLFLDIKPSFSWADGARDIARIDSTYLLNSLCKHASGIHVLPAPSKPAGAEAVTPETVERLLGIMRSTFDIIVMDGCKSFDDLSIRMFALSDTILVVSELNLPSIVNAKKILETLDGLGLSYEKDIKVIINRYQKKTMVSPEEAEKTLGRKIGLMVANDYEMTMSAINTGKTLAEVGLNSPIMENFENLAALLLNKEAVKKEKSAFSLFKENFKDLALRLHRYDLKKKNVFTR